MLKDKKKCKRKLKRNCVLVVGVRKEGSSFVREENPKKSICKT